jgi:dihydrofolate reductase
MLHQARTGLAIIYARSLNHCIGHAGGLPWSLPDEYEHFNQTTIGHPVIMGRRSYEDHDGALQDRVNIVVSRNKKYTVPDDILLATNLAQALQLAAAVHSTYFVIGGAGLISEALPLANTVFETVVDAQIEGDTFLPPLNFAEWTTEMLYEHPVDRQHQFPFQVYQHSN